MTITAPERARLALAAGVNEQYLYQCLTGRRDMEPGQAVEVEMLAAGKVFRWHLRRDWRRIWPELINWPGAPKDDALSLRELHAEVVEAPAVAAATATQEVRHAA